MIWNPFGNKSKKPGAEQYLLDAIEAFENKDFKTALHVFSMIANVCPDHPLANLMIGRIFIEEGKYSRAIDALFNHLKHNPKSIEGIIQLGISYYECGEIERATDRFETAMELRAESVLARENLAIIKFQLGMLEEALADLKELLDKTPDDSGLIELIVLTLGKLGHWEEAKNYARKISTFF